jgi:hypothetical protein
MAERVLLCLYERDVVLGRTNEVSGWYNDLRQALFMFSPQLMHSAELTLLRIVDWDDGEEYGDPIDQYDPGLTLPSGYVGVARIPEGTRQRFRLALRRLLRQRHINAFVSVLRAMKGMGGKKIPVPQLWASENRDKLSDIVGLSLTVPGFEAAAELAAKHKVMHHWQVHRFAAQDEVFAEWLTGRNQRTKAPCRKCQNRFAAAEQQHPADGAPRRR